MMAANRRRDTKPEMRVRRRLHAEGFRFRLDVRSLPGSPDIVLRRYNAVIFVHGCFWHRHEGCKFAATPKSNVKFWQNKFTRNIERDQQATETLLGLGWRVAVVWECALSNTTEGRTMEDLTMWLSARHRETRFQEFGR